MTFVHKIKKTNKDFWFRIVCTDIRLKSTFVSGIPEKHKGPTEIHKVPRFSGP